MSPRLVSLAAGLILAAVPSSAVAQTSGGAVAPDASGGHVFEQSVPRAASRTGPSLRATLFTVTPGAVQLGQSLVFTWRVDGPVRSVLARATLTPEGGGKAISVPLGRRRTGTRSVRRWTARSGIIAAGRYTVRLRARGAGGARLRRTARASGRLTLQIVRPAPVPRPPSVPVPAPVPAVFPIQGQYSFGGDDARFGAGRTGHIHQGQDILAPEGTPLVTPVAGIVFWRAYQEGGAGYYLVIRGDDGRDFVYMHLQAGSTIVEKGQRVAAGQRLGNVGNTGSSDGAHLHFEIWPDGWYATKASRPIDPLPDLLAWAGTAP